MNSRIDDLIALAALGELTADESAELDAAAAADPGVAAELADALTSAASLQALADEAPPTRLRASVLDAISRLDQDVPAGPAGTDPATAVSGTADAGTSSVEDDGTSEDNETSWVTHIESPRRRRFAPLLAAAAVLALVAGGVIIGTDDRGGDDPIAAVLEADDAETMTVSGSIGELELVYSSDENASVLVGSSLEPAPDASTYQAWLVSDGVATSIGTFVTDPDGGAALLLDGVDPAGSTVGITVEPAGGSVEPTLPLVAQSA